MASVDDQKRRVPNATPRKRRPGLPDEASVVSETTLTSPKGATYRILRTNEKDPYDPPESEKKRRR
jgi:hypothetical protein